MDFHPIQKRIKTRNKSDSERLKTPERDKHQKEPRSSSRLQAKGERKFQMPSRDDVWKNISDEDEVKTPKLVQPRRLADSFSRVTHNYNRDRFETYETSDESSEDDFIDDEEAEELPEAPANIKLKRRRQRMMSSSSSELSTSSEEEPVAKRRTPHKMANKVESDVSDSEEYHQNPEFDKQSSSSDTEDYDVNSYISLKNSKYSDNKGNLGKKSRLTPAKKCKRILDNSSDSDDIEAGHNTTPYKNKNRIESSDSDDEPITKYLTKPRSKTYITGETNTEFEDSELDELVVDCLKMYYRYNTEVFSVNPRPCTSKTGLFDAVEGTEQCGLQTKAVINDSQESQAFSVGDLAELSDDSEGEDHLMSPKSRPRADRKVTLREKFRDYKEARRKTSLPDKVECGNSSLSVTPGTSSGNATASKTSNYALQTVENVKPRTPSEMIHPHQTSPPISYTSTPSTHVTSLSPPPKCSSMHNAITATCSIVPNEGTSQTDTGARNPNECSVCLENICDCVICDCGHICACFTCATDIFTKGDKLCPICRMEIRKIQKTYKS